MIKTNYHNHCFLCGHAQGYPIDYVERAIEEGYCEIGISDHGPLLPSWVHRMDIDSFYDIYLQNIDLAIAKHSTKIKIFKGLEIEYLENYHEHYEMLLKDLDYLILGQHIIVDQGKITDIYKEVNRNKIMIYKDMVIKAMETGYFRILAHPDIYMFKYKTWDEFTKKIARDIIEASIKYNVFLEINANGVRRGQFLNQNREKVYIYPRLEFWQIVKEYPGAKIIISEDNHTVNQINDASCIKAREFADSLGLKVSTYLFGDNNV